MAETNDKKVVVCLGTAVVGTASLSLSFFIIIAIGICPLLPIVINVLGVDFLAYVSSYPKKDEKIRTNDLQVRRHVSTPISNSLQLKF